MIKILNDEEIKTISLHFIKGNGYTIALNIDAEQKEFLLRNNLIIENKRAMGTYSLTDDFYKKYKKTIDTLGFSWVEIDLLKEYSPFKVIYFDCELIHLFINNPNYMFKWSGYRGYVYSTDTSRMDIYIRDLCIAYDLENDKPVVSVFLNDLLKNSKLEQDIMRPYILKDDGNKYEFHRYNYKNLFLGEWLEYEEIDIYSLILEGIKLANYIFTKKYLKKLFKNEYSLEDLQFFMPIFFPTKINLFNFMMEVAKIIIDNIDTSPLKQLIKTNYSTMKNNTQFTLDDLKDKRELWTFKTYFNQFDGISHKTFESLEMIRSKRTEPAHQVYINDLNDEYYSQQDAMLKDIYRILCDIIKAEDTDYSITNEYENGNYKNIYGHRGAICLANGFNAKPHRFYNGYIRLINENYDVRDAEILIAGNNLEEMRTAISNHILKTNTITKEQMNLVLDLMFNEKRAIPSDKELSSFFYGQAYIKKFFGECRDYKKEGMKLKKDFDLLNYKYKFIFADSTDMYYDYKGTFEAIDKDASFVFGSGLIMDLLTNNFADNQTNLTNKKNDEDIYVSTNTWD